MTMEQLWAKIYTLELKFSNIEAHKQHGSDISRGDRLVASEYDHSCMVPEIKCIEWCLQETLRRHKIRKEFHSLLRYVFKILYGETDAHRK